MRPTPPDRRDAVLYAAQCNETHGQGRGENDRKNAVLMLLADAEWGTWSNYQIAKACGVDEKTVRNVKASCRASTDVSVDA